MANANLDIHATIEGTQPMYRDEYGNQNYTESIGIGKDGKRYAIIRSNQKVIENNDQTTHVARTKVLASEIPLNGLSNAAQVDKIRRTYREMLPIWSDNFAGREPQTGTEQEMANQLVKLDAAIDNYEPEPMVSQPPRSTRDDFASRSFMEDNPSPPKKRFDITAEEWNDMDKPSRQNYIFDQAVKRNSTGVNAKINVQDSQGNWQVRTRWENLTPKERQNVLSNVRKELGRELKIDI